MGTLDDDWCHYSDMPSPMAYQQKSIYNDMTKSEIISRIIELETPIVERIINDKNFRSTDSDEYQESRIELKILRELVKDELYPPNYTKEGHTQRPDFDSLEVWKQKNIKLK
jgi:hypothetical protein